MTALAKLLDNTGSADPLALRERINIIQAAALQHKDRILALPLTHYFANGVYAREIFIPKDTLAIGRIHKYPQINIISKGDLSIVTDEGIERVQAPFTKVSPAGTKRAVYAHEDTVFTTIIATDETDIDKIEDHLTAASDEDYAAFLANVKMKEIA